jgi:hypothetical protein
MALEGIVAKRRDRPYRSGRSPDWVKIKNPDAPAAMRIMVKREVCDLDHIDRVSLATCFVVRL